MWRASHPDVAWFNTRQVEGERPFPWNRHSIHYNHDDFLTTWAQSYAPRTTRWLTPIRSWHRAPWINTTLCSWELHMRLLVMGKIKLISCLIMREAAEVLLQYTCTHTPLYFGSCRFRTKEQITHLQIYNLTHQCFHTFHHTPLFIIHVL